MGQPPKDPAIVSDDEVDDFLLAFALRFDGYKYAQSRGGEILLMKWTRRFLATLRMSNRANENHAAFFALQRFLGKWGGETLSDESREHLAFRLLFLHLYRAKVPSRYTLEYGQNALRDINLDRLEKVAARVREQIIARTLRHGDPLRPGVGPDRQDPSG